ncbi:MAG: OmpA family protein [Deltaproteobacteria bacterium]
MSNVFVGRNSGRLAVFSLALLVLFAAGCAANKGGLLGTGLFKGSGLSEEELAASPSLTQFEETGGAVAGGEFAQVVFAYDSDVLDDRAMEAVRANVGLLQADGRRRVEIEGHCDDRGSSEYNLALGARRARSVRDALAGLGISTDRLSTVSYGEELPLCKELTEDCWMQNRRVRLVDLQRSAD